MTQAATVDFCLLVIALAGGAVVRFVELGSVGLNSDETVYAGQAASLAGNPHFTGLFPVLRAHPLLFQVLASPFYASGTPDVPGRYLSAAFGVGTIALVFVLGAALYQRRVGAFAALLLAFMPYHVIVSRQILLDGPMTFFATGSLVCLAFLHRTDHRRWLIAAGACLGLAALTKETAIIFVASMFLFLVLASRMWRIRYVLTAASLAIGLSLVYPLLTSLSGGSHSGRSYFLWQLTRQPNHGLGFYLTTVPLAVGPVLLGVVVVGLLTRRRGGDFSREALLLSWIAIPFAFFEFWPVKGFPYLVVITPPVAVLAASVLVRWCGASKAFLRGFGYVAVCACIVAGLVPTASSVADSASSGLAGAGGIPGGREAGRWISANVPENAQLLTIGPSLANIIEYYSGRRADGLSVSPNPVNRNPSYFPVGNADVDIRDGVYQYVVWDTYSADRSRTFAAEALDLVSRFHGQVIYQWDSRDRGSRDLKIVVYSLVHGAHGDVGPNNALEPPEQGGPVDWAALAQLAAAGLRPADVAALNAANSLAQVSGAPGLGVRDARPKIVHPSAPILYGGYGLAMLFVLGIVVWIGLSERTRASRRRGVQR